MSKARRVIGMSTAMVAGLFAASTARGEPSASDRALAQALFDEGRALMDRGQYAPACEKFARSQKLDAGGGTLLNLAACHEKVGRMATAWTELNEALSQAMKDGRSDREEFAREHIAAIVPKLQRLRIVFKGETPGVQLSIDGEHIEVAGDDLRPIDRGTHVVAARAPGRRPWSASVVIMPDRPITDVEVPALADAPADARRKPERVPQPREEPEEPQGGGRRTAAYIVGGLGLTSLGLGTYFGLAALSSKEESDALCPASPCASPEGVTQSEQAVTFAWIANAAIGLGLAGTVAAAYLYVTSRPAFSVTPAVTRSGAGLSVGGTF